MEQHSSETGLFLQEVYTSLTQDLQNFNSSALVNATYVNPQKIDHLVEVELQRIKENCLHKEQQYVEQMLLENPITIERRNNNSSSQMQHQQQSYSDEDMVDVVTISNSTKKDSNAFLQQQRAEACRRSRYNNKIKKAKSKYRHKYMSQKLLQSSQMFECIQELIAQAENHLLTQGLSKEKLEHLRHSYGMEQAIDSVQKLEQTLKME